MEESVKQLGRQLELTAKYLRKALDGLGGGKDVAQASAILNPPLWLAVHLTEARAFLLRMMGADYEPPWGGDLTVADEDLNDPTKYPQVEEIRGAWDEVTEKLLKRLDELTSEDLSQPPPKDLPIDDCTLMGVLNFLAYHETYHVGQLGAWWKKIGEGPFMP